MLALIVSILMIPVPGGGRPDDHACQHVPKPIYYRICSPHYGAETPTPPVP